jgi:hypothetical protein
MEVGWGVKTFWIVIVVGVIAAIWCSRRNPVARSEIGY